MTGSKIKDFAVIYWWTTTQLSHALQVKTVNFHAGRYWPYMSSKLHSMIVTQLFITHVTILNRHQQEHRDACSYSIWPENSRAAQYLDCADFMEHGLISGLNLDLAANPFHQQHEDMKHTTRYILASIMCMVFGFSYTLGKWPAKQNMTYGLHVGLKKCITFLKIIISQVLNCFLQNRNRDFKKNVRLYVAE